MHKGCCNSFAAALNSFYDVLSVNGLPRPLRGLAMTVEFEDLRGLPNTPVIARSEATRQSVPSECSRTNRIHEYSDSGHDLP